MSRVQSIITQSTKIQENVPNYWGERQSTYDNPEITQILELSEKYINVTIITMLYEVKVKILEINGKTEAFSREIETIRPNQIKIV